MNEDTDIEHLAQLLKEFVDWWDEWMNAEFPTEVDDPPVEYAKRIIEKLNLR